MTDKATGQKIKFLAFNLPTPEIAKKYFRYFFIATSCIAMACQVFSFIPIDVTLAVNKYVVQANTYAFFLSRAFGIDLSDVKTKFN